MLVSGAPGAGTASAPRCLGAASRDARHPCHNAALRYRVTPSPQVALLQPYPTCGPPPGPGPPPLCTFGVPPEDAVSTMVLLGDSHAEHWRPALETVADALRWHAIKLTRSGCPFSTATYGGPQGAPNDCAKHNGDVVQFVRDHPEVQTVVVSEDHEPFTPRPGSSARSQQMAGFAAAWAELPDTVRHIVVIRDVTYQQPRTADCVIRAHRRHRDAGLACAVGRRQSLREDRAVAEARRERAADPASRVAVVDMTRFFCGRRRCFPVVGGVLVHKDDGHLTLLYARTLGPYLLSAISAVVGR